MSREAFGDPPESQGPPDLCPVCGNHWHAEDCEFGKEVARRLKAERDAHRLAFENEQLRREAERLQKLLTAMHQMATRPKRWRGLTAPARTMPKDQK